MRHWSERVGLLRLEAGDYLDEVANAPNGTYDEELFASLLSPEQNGDSVPSIPTRKNASLSPTHDTADFCKVVPPQIPSVALPLVAQSQSPSAPASVGDIEAVKPIDGIRNKLKEMRIKNKRWGEEIQSPSFFPSSRRAMISESKKGGETIRNPSFPSSSLVRSPCANQGGDNCADTSDEDSDSELTNLPERLQSLPDSVSHSSFLLKKQRNLARVNRRKIVAEIASAKKEIILETKKGTKRLADGQREIKAQIGVDSVKYCNRLETLAGNVSSMNETIVGRFDLLLGKLDSLQTNGTSISTDEKAAIGDIMQMEGLVTTSTQQLTHGQMKHELASKAFEVITESLVPEGELGLKDRKRPVQRCDKARLKGDSVACVQQIGSVECVGVPVQESRKPPSSRTNAATLRAAGLEGAVLVPTKNTMETTQPTKESKLGQPNPGGLSARAENKGNAGSSRQKKGRRCQDLRKQVNPKSSRSDAMPTSTSKPREPLKTKRHADAVFAELQADKAERKAKSKPTRSKPIAPRGTKASRLRHNAMVAAMKEKAPVEGHLSNKENKRSYCQQQTWTGR